MNVPCLLCTKSPPSVPFLFPNGPRVCVETREPVLLCHFGHINLLGQFQTELGFRCSWASPQISDWSEWHVLMCVRGADFPSACIK